MKKIILISLLTVMALGILIAQRQEQMTTSENPPLFRTQGNPMHNVWEELNLTEAQKEKFAQARMNFERQQNTMSAEIKNLNLDMIQAMKAENIKRVKELNQQISNLELQIKNARVDLMANHLKELNKEQKTIMLNNLPLMWNQQKRMHTMQNKGGSDQMGSGRGAPRMKAGMGEKRQDCQDCEYCDGEIKFKHRN